ncbi:hypothetical protein SAMN05216544_0729 [Lachnospira pectinoschiza]|uniref:Uncharacterized protein n=1 Tax=Lachnospira pectinoschiza TaxID=28052 RepID=A0A1G9UFJ5_9FIRM|nr:hypothetical protein SAMN05216544_0729 [Lachnospira pectinoschiza]
MTDIVSFDRPGVGDSDVVSYYSMESFLQNVYDVRTVEVYYNTFS